MDKEISPAMTFVTNLLPLVYSGEMMVGITLKGLPLNLYSSLMLIIISSVFLLMAYFVYRFKKVEV